jgi:hypothetical protein
MTQAKMLHEQAFLLNPQTHYFVHLCSLLRALNGTRMRDTAVLTRLDVSFNLVADVVP